MEKGMLGLRKLRGRTIKPGGVVLRVRGVTSRMREGESGLDTVKAGVRG